MATFHLQIVTPDRKVYDAQAERIILRTVNGDGQLEEVFKAILATLE